MALFLIFALVLFLAFYAYNLYSPPVLMYHSITDKLSPDYPVVYPGVFKVQLEFMKRRRYNPISFDRYCGLLLQKARIPRRTVIITFDDGREDNLHAAEILRDLGISATFFVSPGLIGNPGFLSRDALRRMLEFPGVTIGAHTVDHVYLPDADDATLQKEISGSKSQLEEILKRPVSTLSYPLGGFDHRVLAAAKNAGYLGACTTNRGFSRWFDLFAVRRIKLKNNDTGFSLWFKLSGYYHIFNAVKRPA
jgi:peptidoglycan/xylan/chitin deacetylase (PgdA/CDA1 family)